MAENMEIFRPSRDCDWLPEYIKSEENCRHGFCMCHAAAVFFQFLLGIADLYEEIMARADGTW